MTFYPASDDGVTTIAPIRRRVGHEIDAQNRDQSLPGAALQEMVDNGIATPPLPPVNGRCSCGCGMTAENPGALLHPYRCRCDHRDNHPIHPTSDNGAEFIIGGSKGVLYGSDRYLEAVDVFCRMADQHGFGPNLLFASGGHTHVEMLLNGPERSQAHRILTEGAEACKIQFLQLARGNQPKVRGYQRNAASDFVRSAAFRVKEYGTVEFRLWNGSVDPTTISLSAAVSAAMMETAELGRTNTGTDILDWIGEFLTDDMANEVDSRLAIATTEGATTMETLVDGMI